MAQWAKEFAAKSNTLILSAEPTWQKDKMTHANWLTPTPVCVYVYTYICIYIQYIYTYTHVFIHIHTDSLVNICINNVPVNKYMNKCY